MFKDKKKVFILMGGIVVILLGITSVILFGGKKETGDNNVPPKADIVIPDAPAENTESLVQDVKKMEVASLDNDIIEFNEEVTVNVGEKVAVWVYSEPKFLGYFEVVMENGIKQIKGLSDALENLNIKSGAHNLAIVTEEGDSIGYVDVYIDENKLFQDQQTAIESKYTTKEIIEKQEVKYQTETKRDSNKKNGYREVTQAGVNGEMEITYKVTYDETGKEISKEKVSEKIIKKAINEIVVIGSADYNINTSKITNEIIGFMCSESQTVMSEGRKVCNDFLELSSFKMIAIDNGTLKVVSINETAITPITVTKNGNLYVGTYKGETHYFESRGGGGNPDGDPLTFELCKQYNLSCGAW